MGQLCQRVLLPHDADHIECQSEWQMGLTAHPEATYLLFPFDLPDAQARFDVGGVPVRPRRRSTARRVPRLLHRARLG